MKQKMMYMIFACVFVAMLGLGVISPLLPEFARRFDASGLWLGMVFSGFAIARMFIMPFIGGLSDKKGKKIFIQIGFLILTLISLAYLRISSIYSLVLIRMVHGLGAGMVMPLIMAFAGEGMDKGKEGRMMGLLTMMFYLGWGSGPLLGGVVSQRFGANAAFYVMAIASAISLLMISLFLKEDKPALYLKNNNAQKPPSIAELFRKPSIKLMLLIIIGVTFRSSVIMAFLPSLADNYGITPSGVGIIISIGIYIAAITIPIFGHISDKISRPGKLIQILAGSFAGTAAILFLPACKSFLSLLVINTIIGISAAVSVASAAGLSVVIGQRIGMGLWMGIYNSAVSLGIIIAPLLCGVIMDAFGIRYAFYASGAMSLGASLIGALIFMGWFKGYKRKHAIA